MTSKTPKAAASARQRLPSSSRVASPPAPPATPEAVAGPSSELEQAPASSSTSELPPEEAPPVSHVPPTPAPMPTSEPLPPADPALGLPPPVPIIVFGVPHGAKMPVAARFTPEDATLAVWIAHNRGLRILDATTPTTQAIAASLAGYNLHPTRGAILNTLPRPTFEKLLLLTAEARARSTHEGDHVNWVSAPESGSTRFVMAQTLWNALEIKDVVLTPEYDQKGASQGWWEAAILAVRDDEYVVCWIEDPLTGFRRRKRHELALIHPGR